MYNMSLVSSRIRLICLKTQELNHFHNIKLIVLEHLHSSTDADGTPL